MCYRPYRVAFGWRGAKVGTRMAVGAPPPSSPMEESILPVPPRAPPPAQSSLSCGKWGQGGPPSSCCRSHTGPTDHRHVPGLQLRAAAEVVVLPWRNLPEGSMQPGAASPLLGSAGGMEWIWGGLCLVPRFWAG